MVGIVISNGILLVDDVDDANQSRVRSDDVWTAIGRAGRSEVLGA
jgi:hypothetical protein